ncbi:hypothetical protein HWV62_30981 [Athelia sp. TMB]|nr:hypothetical protein HWV62_30981 [Athelia sp. TMB]
MTKAVLYSTSKELLDSLYSFDTSAFNEFLGPIYESFVNGEEKKDRVDVVVWNEGNPILPESRWKETEPFIQSLISELNRNNITPARSLFGARTLLDYFSSNQARPINTVKLYSIISLSPPLLDVNNATDKTIFRANLSTLSSENKSDLVKLRVGFFAHGTDPISFSESESEQMLKRAFDIGVIWLCRMNGRIAGYLYAARPTAKTVQLRQLFVGEEWRNQGVGSALVRWVSRVFLEGFEHGTGDLTVDEVATKWGKKKEVCLIAMEEDQDAIRLYEKLGFNYLGDYCSTRF